MANYQPRHVRSKTRRRRDKRKNTINFILTLLIILFICGILFSTYEIIKWYIANDKNEKIMDDISTAITIEEGEGTKERYSVNFKLLKLRNKDTVGWLKVNGTKIEYAVVQGEDNDYYLNHNYNGDEISSGWIFADYRNKFDGTDKNISIYGHNMKDNTMFATLKNVIKEEWYENEENLKINFITEEENAVYQVFSVYQILSEDYFLSTDFRTDSEFEKFVNTMIQRSKKDFNVEVTKEDQILTLSTCATNDKYRVVLHAKKL